MARFARLIVVFAASIVLMNCPSAPKPPAATVAAPAFSPAEGTYTSAQSVTLSTSTAGADIRYTTDATVPSAATGTPYTGPIQVSATTTIRAIALKAGMSDSPVVSAVFSITGTVADVQFSPAAGTFKAPTTVTLSTATDGADIYVTLDGTDPSASNGTHYAGPLSVAATTTLRAVAVKADWKDSAVASAAYTITGTVAGIQFDPEPGSYDTSATVELRSATPGAQIYYTTDGSDPSASNGTLYEGTISITETQTLKAVGVEQDWDDSAIASGLYTINVPVTVTVAPVSDDEISAARNGLARAKEVDADFFDPDNYDAARRFLDEAIDLRTRDPGSARERLASSLEKSDLAFTNAVRKAAQDMSASMEAARKRLLDLEADKFFPPDYQKATAGIDEATSLFDQQDYAGARARGYQALKDMTDLANRVQTRLASVRTLKFDTEQVMKQVESSDAYTWAPGQKDKVNSLYLQGLDGYRGYRLDDAEEGFGAAREAAIDTLRIAKEAKDTTQAAEKQKAEALQAQVMQSLLDAATLTVVTEDGTVIKPQKWTEEDFLKEIDQMIQQDQGTPSSGGTSMAIPSDGSTVVMADDASVSLLQQARDLWSQGLKEKAAGNYGKAQDYFTEAQRYIEIYRSYAVKGVYTVRLILDRRDCLWRIAEYKDIYGDPYKWPTIWRRNRKLIQNPDLIYPGWQLVIPLQ